MRVKKQKRIRRAVSFYTACFGFRQPFKILCDGTFVHHLIVNCIAPADKARSNILGGAVKLFTTRCVNAELKRLCNSYSESLQAAHKLMTARCDHENKKGAEGCTVDIIGENNPEDFFVATQDFDLRKKFREVPGVPIIFGLRNALFLEPPSSFQQEFVKNSEEGRLHVTELEYKMLKNTTKSKSTKEESRHSSDENEGPGDENLEMQPVKKQNARKKMDIKDRPMFKRRKAKAPNPLSCKKKEKNVNPKPPSEKESNAGNNAVRSRSRRRKRSRKEKQVTEIDGTWSSQENC